MDLNSLLAAEDLQIKHLSSLVTDSINDEVLLSQKLAELETDNKATVGQKVADKVAEFGGSWKFIISFGVFMLLWIALNAGVMWYKPFDPYPFIFLNLVLSCLAALQAPVIMMSQNRQEEKDRRRARGDVMVNLKAEMEIQNLNRKIDLLIAEEMKELFKVQRAQMESLAKIEKALSC